MALPRVVASCFRPSLFSATTIINNHRLRHYSLQFPIHNFSSTSQKFQLKVADLTEATLIEENDNSSNVSDVISSPNLVAMEYADLNLPHNEVPAEVPDWNDVFRDPSLPLMVDIGCGTRVGRAECAVLEGSIKNFGQKISGHFMFANATISFQQLASSYPGPLVSVSILCPDPHFKKRHHKRRVLQKPLVFVQSDVHEVAVDMRKQFDIVSDLLHIDAIDPDVGCDHDGWLLRNPMGIRTEREIHAELEGAKIYRRLYQKSK
ncbi:hypothetical protein RDABS01_008581 [Bienertia sinuspersici]